MIESFRSSIMQQVFSQDSVVNCAEGLLRQFLAFALAGCI